MTLIETGNGDGTTGRCDARCYDATGPECNCCCDGMNHGVGRNNAVENTRKAIGDFEGRGMKITSEVK